MTLPERGLMINTETKLFAIIGHPIKHSFSPVMQNAWFEKEKFNCSYLAFEVPPKSLKKAVDSFKILGFAGINVTVPLKTGIMKFLDYTDKAAKAIGAANTIAVKNGKLYGYNTDHSGFSSDLISKHIKVRNKTVFIFGAGGASRAVIHALKNAEAKHIYISNRTYEKARDLAKTFKITAVPAEKIKTILPETDLLVNTSACGMKRTDTLPFEAAGITKNTVIYDLIYGRKTPFAKLAAEKKLKYFSGEGMLINQGAHGFKIWTGIYPDTKSALKLFKKYTR